MAHWRAVAPRWAGGEIGVTQYTEKGDTNLVIAFKLNQLTL